MTSIRSLSSFFTVLASVAVTTAVWVGCASGNGSTIVTSDAAACASSQTTCSGSCTSTQTDNANCGACGKACAAGEACSAGLCTTSCAATEKMCKSASGEAYCASTTTDNANCGACGTTCTMSQVCSAGACASTCDGAGETACTSGSGAAYCTLTASDEANCGGCGKACAAGSSCVMGACATPTAGCTTSQLMCATEAGAFCANVQTDEANCGSCGKSCARGQACVSGACVGGGLKCGADGGAGTLCVPDGGAPFCTDTQTDDANCGACGKTCPVGQACSGGTCSNSCGGVDGGGETRCTRDGGAPYCAATKSDNANCGACGKVCPAGDVCTAGVCSSSCGGVDGGGETRCAPDGGAPYCADTKSDNANCGGCGNTCVTGQVCSSGQCASPCQPVLLISTIATPQAGLVSSLQASTSEFCSVDYFNINGTTALTAAFIAKYSAVLVYNDNGFPYTNAAALGNTLATYFNGGGRVVVALFADAGYPLAGAFVTDNYLLIAPVGAPQAADSFSSAIATQDLVPTSPILVGVTTITGTGTGWRGTQSVENGGMAVAKWASGEPLAVTGKVTDGNGHVRNRVDLNILPSDIASGAWTGNGIQLLRNALLYQ